MAATAKHTLWLDSADSAHPFGRYSFLCCDPQKVICIQNPTPDIFGSLRAGLGPPKPLLEDLPPFQGGLAGFISYDLAWGLDPLSRLTPPEKGGAWPALLMGLYTQVVAIDHAQDLAWLITHGEKEKHRAFLDRFGSFLTLPPLQRGGLGGGQVPPIALTPTCTRKDYEGQIKKVIEHIRQGDIFQANLSQRFVGTYEGTPAEHYLALRERNPAPMGGYFDVGGGRAIASASPERFLRTDSQGQVETCPIKGTLPRHQDPALLLASTKDRAENTMIVDLLRNDLSRVCTDESVDVAELCALQTFAKVHHLVSTVKGTLAPFRDSFDLLAACWPGGSVTGAPKLRAMEVIDALEDTQRGPYCGSLAYIGFAGQMDSNILIRTLIFSGNQISLRVGGGITLASDPHKEYEETLTKAQGMTHT